MSLISESYIEKACVKYAKEHGFNYRKIKFIGVNGAPDRLFFKPPNRMIWIEFKKADGVVSEIQKYQQKLLKESGQEVYNIYSIDEFKDLIK